MINSSFLSSKNKVSLEKVTSFGSFYKICLPIFIFFLLVFGIPLSMFLLEIATNGDSRIITWLIIILYIMSIPFFLIYGYVILKNFLLTIKIFIDIKKGIDRVQITKGKVKAKDGKKTWGSGFDEYSLIINKDSNNYYIDRIFYSKVNEGDNVTLQYLKESKVVIRYHID